MWTNHLHLRCSTDCSIITLRFNTSDTLECRGFLAQLGVHAELRGSVHLHAHAQVVGRVTILGNSLAYR